jgi:hypothetical protein
MTFNFCITSKMYFSLRKMLEIYAKCPNNAKLFAETFFKGGNVNIQKDNNFKQI